MIELILLTGAYRLNNLHQSFDSIYDNFANRKDVHVTWLICVDQFNKNGDINPIIEKCENACKEFGMGYWIFPSGKKRQPNYGGDLYNNALKWVKENYFKDSDPWIYIFDDDNIIHPAFACSLEKVTSKSEANGKDIIWFTKSQMEGFITPSSKRKSYAFKKYKNGKIEATDLPDPSQLLMKYSTIEEFGFFVGGLEYDRKLWEFIEINESRVLYPSDWLPVNSWRDFCGQVQTYHNGQITDKEVESINSLPSDKSYMLICQGNDVTDGRAFRVVLPNEVGEKAMSDAISYYTKKGYIMSQNSGVFDKIDKIYILTLTSTPERWNFVINQFKALGVYEEIKDKIEVVKGSKIPFIDDKVINILKNNGVCVDAFHGGLKQQNVGLLNCGIEHYRILKKAIADGCENIMILEDDACFIKNIDAIRRCLETAPSDYTILHLEGYYNPVSEDDFSEKLNLLSPNVENAKWVEFGKMRMWATACLIYSRRGMEEVVKGQEEFFAVVDWRTGAIVDDAYFYSYPIVRQEDAHNLKSGIHTSVINDSSNLYLKFTNREDYFSIFDGYAQ